MRKAKTDLLLSYPDGTKQSIRLRSKPLNQGADGVIYAAPGGKLALKLYHEPSKDPERPQKIRQMLAAPPNDTGMVHFAWPIAKLESRRGQFAGYAMALLPIAEYANLDLLLTRKGRQLGRLPHSREFRTRAAEYLALRVSQLHARGHCIIDLKPANMLVNRKTADIVVVDCDGFAIQGDGVLLPAHQYTTGYIAPEAWTRQAKPEELGKQQDLFALAVIIFQLLNEGLHPYQGIPNGKQIVPDDTQSRIAENLFAYGQRPNARLKPSPWSLHLDFPLPLRQAFDRAFSRTDQRPEALSWADRLQQGVTQLKSCKTDREHRFWGKQCPLCKQHAVTVQVKKPKRRTHRARRPSPQPHQPPYVQAITQAYQTAQVTRQPPGQSRQQSMSFFSIIGVLFFVFLAAGYILHLHSENQPKTAPNSFSQRQADEEDRRWQARQQELQQQRARNAWRELGDRAQAITVHQSEHPLPASPRVPGMPTDAQTGQENHTAPHFQLGAFDSYRRLPMMFYSPFSPAWEYAREQPIRATNLDPLTNEFQPSSVQHAVNDSYQMMDWQQHPHSNALYLRTRGFQWNSYALARLAGNGEVSEYRVYQEHRNDGSGARRAVAPWHFAVTEDEKHLIIAAHDSLRVYAIADPTQPVAEVEFPLPFNRFEVSDLAITSDGSSIFVGLSRNLAYGLNYHATVLEYSMTSGKLEFVTDFMVGWRDDAAVPSGSVSVSADGKTLAIGEYRDLEIDGSRYTQFGRAVKVRTGLPGIQIWQKSEPDYRWQRSGRYSLNRRDRIATPDNHAMADFMSSGIPTGTYRFNLGFELTPDGQRLLSGIETERNSRMQAVARSWVFEIRDGAPVLRGRLESSAKQSTGHKVNARPFTRLSNDGAEAVIGWAIYRQSVLNVGRNDLQLSLIAFRLGEQIAPGRAQIQEH